MSERAEFQEAGAIPVDDPSPQGRGAVMLRRRSRVLARMCLVLAAGLPVLLVMHWLEGGIGGLAERLTGPLEGAEFRPDPAAFQLALAVALAMLPMGAVGMALLAGRRCFLAFADGGWFTEAPAKALQACGRWSFIAAGLGLVMPTVLTLVLTLHAAPGGRILSITLSSETLLGALAGGMLWLLGDVQRRAARLASDHAQII